MASSLMAHSSTLPMAVLSTANSHPTKPRHLCMKATHSINAAATPQGPPDLPTTAMCRPAVFFSSSARLTIGARIQRACACMRVHVRLCSHSPQIGWAADGFPVCSTSMCDLAKKCASCPAFPLRQTCCHLQVYGPRGKDGAMVQTCSVSGGPPPNNQHQSTAAAHFFRFFLLGSAGMPPSLFGSGGTYGTDTCSDDCTGVGSATGGEDWIDDRYTYRCKTNQTSFFCLTHIHSTELADYVIGPHDDGKQCTSPSPLGTSSAEYYPMTAVCLKVSTHNQSLAADTCRGVCTKKT